MENTNITPKMSRHRTSSVGKIDLGDTRVRSFSTSRTSHERTASDSRIDELSKSSKTDLEILTKIKIGFIELNYRHTWLLPFIVMSIVYAAYFTSGNYTESNFLHMFVSISYQVGDTNQYGKGPKDLAFISFYMIFFTFFREFCMEVILRPFAKIVGVKKPQKVKRFMEQSYSVIYYGISGPFGLYVMSQTDLWLFRTDTMYATYPDLTNDYLYKLFYLGQGAFWAQQSVILILQVEKPRKDFKELVLHHIVTMSLIWLSYVFHFTKMGLAVYITMDVSDFFLAVSKDLNYLDSPLVGPWFVLFVGVWIYLRHYINLKILWSVLTEFRTVGDFKLNFATQQYKCWISLPIVFVLIGALQLVNLYWLFLILRILYRFVFGGVAQDDRSDDESEEDEKKEK